MSGLVEWILIGGVGLVLGASVGLWVASKIRVRFRKQVKEEQVDSTERKLKRLALEMETWQKVRGRRE